jgi:3-methyl-2-oxobutanoate hydroxymethyltransferase
MAQGADAGQAQGQGAGEGVQEAAAPYGGGSAGPKRVRTRHFSQAKRDGVKIVGLTSYDYLSAGIFDRAGIDFLLVGDSAGNTVFGYDTTLPVTVDELIPLTRAVARGAKRALVIADLPFGSYETNPREAVHTAIRFMKETGAHAVKLEGGERSAEQIRRIVEAGIPVMAHIGFTPQSEHGLGGHVIQARGDAGMEQLLRDAHAVEEAGAFAVVLEMVPSEAARLLDDLGRRGPALRRPAARLERLGGLHERSHPEVRQAVRAGRADARGCRGLVPSGCRVGRLPGARARVRVAA